MAWTMIAACLAAADWPQFRGPDGQGSSPAKGLPLKWSASENLAWKAALPGPGGSSPALHGERIYLTCYTGYNIPGRPRGAQDELRRVLVALDRKTGKEIWQAETPAKLPEQERIRDDHGYATSTPAVDAERVYCFFGKTGVKTFGHDGKPQWSAEVGDGLNGWGSAASPVLHDGMLYVNASVESESLFAFDAATGKERWRARGIKESWNTPILVAAPGGKKELVVATQGQILGFDPATGERLWNCATDIRWYMVPSMVAADGVVYALGGRSGVASLAVRAGGRGDVTATHRMWTGMKGSNVSSPVLHQGRLYWMNDNNETAYCAEAATGAIVYERRVPRAGQVYASALLADGRVHYLSRDGKGFVVAAAPDFTLLATNDLRDRSLFHATPVADDRRLYLRSDAALYCVEAK